MRRIACPTLLFLAALVFLSTAGKARAAETRSDAPRPEAPLAIPASLPECDDAFVLAEISRDFSVRERASRGSDLAIMGYDRIREAGRRSDGENRAPRRYCSALADFGDGHERRVDYSIGESFAGVGWGVEWCVSGFDRDHGAGTLCREARP